MLLNPFGMLGGFSTLYSGLCWHRAQSCIDAVLGVEVVGWYRWQAFSWIALATPLL